MNKEIIRLNRIKVERNLAENETNRRYPDPEDLEFSPGVQQDKIRVTDSAIYEHNQHTTTAVEENTFGKNIDELPNFVVGAVLQLLRFCRPIHVRSPQQSVFVHRYTDILFSLHIRSSLNQQICTLYADFDLVNSMFYRPIRCPWLRSSPSTRTVAIHCWIVVKTSTK